MSLISFPQRPRPPIPSDENARDEEIRQAQELLARMLEAKSMLQTLRADLAQLEASIAEAVPPKPGQ